MWRNSADIQLNTYIYYHEEEIKHSIFSRFTFSNGWFSNITVCQQFLIKLTNWFDLNVLMSIN